MIALDVIRQPPPRIRPIPVLDHHLGRQHPVERAEEPVPYIRPQLPVAQVRQHRFQTQTYVA